jgi:hypothetical protein
VVRGDGQALALFRSFAGDIVAAGSVATVTEEELPAPAAALTADVVL